MQIGSLAPCFPAVGFPERLQAAMDRKGMNASQLARATRGAVPPNHISSILAGRIQNPTVSIAAELARALDVSLNELSGLGRPIAVDELLLPSPDHDEPREHHVIMVPIVGAAPGGPQEEAIHYQNENHGLLRHLVTKNRYVIRLYGDSMFPTYWPNDLLLIELTSKVRDDDVAVVRVGTESTVKRIRLAGRKGIRLLADNPNYQPHERLLGPDDDFQIEGKVVAIVKGERP
jgi:phage repressor protein C with HTH and peptisase S24 domain